MSAGFFGSFFRRSNAENARASRAVHSPVDAVDVEPVDDAVSIEDTSAQAAPARTDATAPVSTKSASVEESDLRPAEKRNDPEPPQSTGAAARPPAELGGGARQTAQPPRHRLDWLKDLMDEDAAETAAKYRASDNGSVHAPVHKGAPAERTPAESRPDEPAPLSHHDPSSSDEADSREPDFYRDSILEDDHYPFRPIETVGEVDAISPLKSSSVSGDGFRESSVPEARYKETPPAPLNAGPVDSAEASDDVESEQAEASAEKSDDAAEAPVPDVPVDDVLIDQIRRKDRVVAMLLRKEIVSPQQVANAQQKREQGGTKDTLWRVLATLKTVDSEAVYAEAARVYAFREVAPGEGGPDVDFARSVMDTFPEELRDRLIQMQVLPFAAEMEKKTGAIKLVFVTHDPTRPEMHKVMQDLKLERFELRYAPEGFVRAFILEAFPRKNEFLERMSEGSMRYDLGASFDEKSSLIDEDALEAEISRSSLINLFEATLVEAVRRGASDIHIYPNAEKHIEVHFRVDGRLGHWYTEQKVHPEALLAVIKDNAMNVDRFERDSAQDGFIQRWIDDALIRFRVSVLPIANAVQEMRSESIVIRVLDDRKVITDLRTLGLLDTAFERFEMAIRQPHGMVILTGPTGSGKSTTLVAAMHQVVTPEVNVLTVEDPVEYIIPGVRQIKLNHKLGLEEALRAILRHDPDVVMVGEMRDRQTADLAIKLANTGHLTFSTLHTNDAPSAVSRLFKMGIEPFLIAYAINMVVAQRLIRTLCKDCKRVDDDPDHVMLKKLGFTEDDIATKTIYRTGDNPKCKTCKGTSYKGRRAVTEALYFSRPIRHLIVEAQNMIDEESIRQAAVKEGMLTLKDSAREIVKMGETSITEMIRVVTTDH